ncbi:serine carboxypeptidase 24-like protein [Tanacetum coccineum]
MSSCTFTTAKYTQKCDDAINYAWSNEFGEIDQYNIYTPSCHRTSGNYTSKRLKNSLVRGMILALKGMHDGLLENWKDSEFLKLPTYKELIAPGYKIWVGGWSEVYNGLTFETVRGAGHEVPLLQPQRGCLLFQLFLAGKSLPRSRVS